MNYLNHIYDLSFIYNVFENNLNNLNRKSFKFVYLKTNENKISKYKKNYLYFKSNLSSSQKIFYFSTSYFMFVPLFCTFFYKFLNFNINEHLYKIIAPYILFVSGLLSIIHWGNYNPGSYVQKLDIIFVLLDLTSTTYDYYNILNKSSFLKKMYIFYLFLILFICIFELYYKKYFNYLNIDYDVYVIGFYAHALLRILGFNYILTTIIKFDNIFQYISFFFNIFVMCFICYYITEIYFNNNKNITNYDLILFSILGIFLCVCYLLIITIIMNLTKNIMCII